MIRVRIELIPDWTPDELAQNAAEPKTWHRTYPNLPRLGDELELDGWIYTVEMVRFLDPEDSAGEARRLALAPIYMRVSLGESPFEPDR